jgi:YHS domain-containing protein
MKSILSAVIVIVFFMCSCGNAVETRVESTTQAPPLEKPKKDFSVLKFTGGDKDLVCGMKLTMGIEDTLTHNSKLYGFCSEGCKEAFVKNPAEFLVAK